MAEQKFTTDELTNEIWKPVFGFEDAYSVSNLGRVRREKPNPVNGFGVRRLLKGTDDGKGYKRVCLADSPKKQYRHIYSLVAEAFLGPRPLGHHIDHVDTKKTNDRLSNLEYVTEKENHRRAAVKGLYGSGDRNGHHTKPERTPRGEDHKRARLTENDVRAIRAEYEQSPHLTRLGKRFGVSPQQIYRIVHRKLWQHIP